MSPLSSSTSASSTVDRCTRKVMLETGLTRGMATRAPGSDERNQEQNAMKRMVGFRQMATFRQLLEQPGAACRNRVWMIASPRMAAAPDDRLVIDAIPAQVWKADPDGAIQFVNEIWLDYTGLSVDQTQG